MILDIRNNGGGLLDDAVQIVNLFTPKGEVVLSTKGRTKRSERIYRTTLAPTDTDIPIAVLVNRGSASSSEILSGALQDMDRAVIVGQRTYGKGLVQATRELPYGGSLKVTISKYYIPSGRCIQAIDYTNRNEDGSVGRIPDSLTTEFKTAGGRIVRDGGGILPDVEVEAEKIPTMIYYLVNEQIIFDFVTNWCIDRPKIESIENFKLTDSDYEAFKTFVKTKDFKYDRGSEKALEVLKEYMEMEGYDKTASAEYKALMDKLVPDVERDLDAFKPEISKFIVSEIAKRYYYNRGEILEQLKTDKEVAKAVEILNDSATYKKILSPAE